MSNGDRETDLLLRWQDLKDQGNDVTPEELCAESPELLDNVRRGIDKLRGLDAVRNGEGEPKAVPPDVSGYEILGTLGRGGMGIVYKARHVRLNRLVALKVPLAGKHAAPEQLLRFLTEARAVARMQHPNIVQIYDVGEADGQPYFAMEFVEGGSLDKKLAGTPLSSDQAATLVESVARAVHAAHDVRIVHRDLKPGNVLLTGEGVPKVSDFGLARLLDAEATQTRSGAPMGTPSYMAPEQALGASRQISSLTDVYALGAILYETLTGRPPFKGENALETLKQVQEKVPVAPRELRPKVPRDLETVCLKCLEKEPAKRYSSAGEVAEELARFLRNEPIHAKPVGYAERAWRWCRRRPAIASLAASLVLITLVGFAGVTWQWLRAEANGVATRVAQEKAEGNARAAIAQNNLALDTLQSVLFDVQGKLEDVPAAHSVRRSLLKTAIDGLQKIIRNAETAPEQDHCLVLAHFQIGQIFLNLGNTDQANQYIQRCYEIAQAPMRTDPSDLRAQRDFAMSLEGRGDVMLALGKKEAARDAYDRSLEFRRALAITDAEYPQTRRNLCVAYRKLGQVSLDLQDTPTAEFVYRKYVEVAQAMSKADPDSIEVQRTLLIAHGNLGDLSLTVKNPRAAKKSYCQTREIAQKLAEITSEAWAQRDLSVAYNKLGHTCKQLGQLQAAKDNYQKSLTLRTNLLKADPKNPAAQRDLAITYEWLGTTCFELREIRSAMANYREGWAICEKLAKANPSESLFQCMWAQSHYRLGLCNEQQCQFHAACDFYELALAVAQRLENEGRLKLYTSLPKQCKHALNVCRAAPRALEDLDFALHQPSDIVPRLLILRCRTLAIRSKHTDASVAAGKLAELSPISPANLYDSACGYAHCVAAIGQGKRSDQFTDAERASQDLYAGQAVKLLASAYTAGYFKDPARVELMENDKDLDPLRSRAEYKRFWAELAETTQRGDK